MLWWNSTLSLIILYGRKDLNKYSCFETCLKMDLLLGGQRYRSWLQVKGNWRFQGLPDSEPKLSPRNPWEATTDAQTIRTTNEVLEMRESKYI